VFDGDRAGNILNAGWCMSQLGQFVGVLGVAREVSAATANVIC